MISKPKEGKKTKIRKWQFWLKMMTYSKWMRQKNLGFKRKWSLYNGQGKMGSVKQGQSFSFYGRWSLLHAAALFDPTLEQRNWWLKMMTGGSLRKIKKEEAWVTWSGRWKRGRRWSVLLLLWSHVENRSLALFWDKLSICFQGHRSVAWFQMTMSTWGWLVNTFGILEMGY